MALLVSFQIKQKFVDYLNPQHFASFTIETTLLFDVSGHFLLWHTSKRQRKKTKMLSSRDASTKA
jgi:hypothetical protein